MKNVLTMMTVLAAVLAASSTLANAAVTEYLDCELALESPNNGMTRFVIYVEDQAGAQTRPALLLTRIDGTNGAFSGTISGTIPAANAGEQAKATFEVATGVKLEMRFAEYTVGNGAALVDATFLDPDLNQTVTYTCSKVGWPNPLR